MISLVGFLQPATKLELHSSLVFLGFLVLFLLLCSVPLPPRDSNLILYNPPIIRNLIQQVQNGGWRPSFSPLFLYVKTVLYILGHKQSVVFLLMAGHCI